MHKDISIAVMTRHRPAPIGNFLRSLSDVTWDNTPDERIPHTTILYDSPIEPSRPADFLIDEDYVSEIILYEKSGLAELWNWCVMLSPTDWVFICQDDISFNSGWLDYCEARIAEGKHKLVHLFHYGAMLFHKSLILSVGWFDERFRGGGYEDNDYQLRISEAGIKHLVDCSHDFIRRDGNVEIGHFCNHHKYEYSSENNWRGNGNAEFIKEKWGTNLDWRMPAYRQISEIDWHPTYTSRYAKRFDEPAAWKNIGAESMKFKRGIRH